MIISNCMKIMFSNSFHIVLQRLVNSRFLEERIYIFMQKYNELCYNSSFVEMVYIYTQYLRFLKY